MTTPPHVTAALDQAWAEIDDLIGIMVEVYRSTSDADRGELAGALCDQAWIQNETAVEAVGSLASLLACAISRLANQPTVTERK